MKVVLVRREAFRYDQRSFLRYVRPETMDPRVISWYRCFGAGIVLASVSAGIWRSLVAVSEARKWGREGNPSTACLDMEVEGEYLAQ